MNKDSSRLSTHWLNTYAVIIGFSIPLAFASDSCAGGYFLPSIEGVIVDSDTSKPIENVIISVTRYKYSILQVLNLGGAAVSQAGSRLYAQTDRSGHFKLKRRFSLSLEPIYAVDIGFFRPFYDSLIAYDMMEVAGKSHFDLGEIKMKRSNVSFVSNYHLREFATSKSVYQAWTKEIENAGYWWDQSKNGWHHPIFLKPDQVRDFFPKSRERFEGVC